MTAADVHLPWHRDGFDRLLQRAEAGQLAHALLLDGPSGWGQGFMARQLARALLDLPLPAAGSARCGTPETDQDLLSHPDFRRLAPTETDAGKLRTQIRIDEVRAANEFLLRTAARGRRVLLVELAEQLNISASNALLKRLEEPGAGTHILLVSHAPGRVLATIRSRCQRIALPAASAAVAAAWLEDLDDPAAAGARELLELTGGAPLQALDYAERDVADLARAIEAGLTADRPLEQAAVWAQHPTDLVLDLLYRILARQARDQARDDASPASTLRLLERVLFARRALLSQTNPNATLLFEDLLAGWKQLRARTG